MTKPKHEPRVRRLVELPRKHWKQLQGIAAARGVSVAQLIREAIAQHLVTQ